MDERLQHSRAQKFFEFSKLANEAVDKYKGKVPKKMRREIESYRMRFESAKEDPILGEVAKVYIEVLDYLIEYLDTQNEEAFKKSQEAHERGDEMIWKILAGRREK